MSRESSRARDRATELWSLAVRARDRCCQYCGQWGRDNDRGLPVVGLEAAHQEDNRD